MEWQQALILLEGQRSVGLLYVNAAERLGLHPITMSADPAQYDYLAAESVVSFGVDTDDLDAPIRECSRLSVTYDIARIPVLRARKRRSVRQSASSAGISVYRERTPYRLNAAMASSLNVIPSMHY
ncbi:MAG: hypothetical protein EOS10_35140 [Mesorhizobium sp.]|nr:MAG: hypothetical protein EOR49_33330 [Mesorhizobium sp.]RWM40977.1 MAG: hypothetical protein EOR76_35210 [Mesorhizobium sp.]RWO22288.1 MAG: hypothetical protein EOS10_35140 [Mesorhizobium sp.]